MMRLWVLLLIPMVSAAPTTLYLHASVFEDMPINTQEPEDRYGEPLSLGLAAASTCVEDPTGIQHLTSRQSHTWYGFSAPSYVEYEFDENGRPRIHTERGLSYDVELDTDMQPVFHWYLRGYNPFNSELPHPPLPGVHVQVTMREGDDVSVGHTAFNTGKIVMQGTSQGATLAGPMSDGDVTFSEVDGQWIYGFAVPLTIEKSVIDKQEGFNLRIDVWMDEPYCEDGYTMAGFVQRFSQQGFYPRLELGVDNPLKAVHYSSRFVGDDLLVLALFASPWGGYDVSGDREGELPMEARIWGPIERSLTPDGLVNPFNHNGVDAHQQPVQTGWRFNISQAPAGTYNIDITAWNDQGTANVTARGTLEIGAATRACHEDELERVCLTQRSEEPAPAPWWLVLGLLAFARRR